MSKNAKAFLKQRDQNFKNKNLDNLLVPLRETVENFKDNKLAVSGQHKENVPEVNLASMAERLDKLPARFASLSLEELKKEWNNSEKIGHTLAWTRGHILAAINKKYGDAEIAGLAKEQNLSSSSLYNYIKLVEIFPKADHILEPTFHLRAIYATGGDAQKAIALIAEAKEKKKENPRYSLRDFQEKLQSKTKKGSPKPASGETIIKKIFSLLEELKNCDRSNIAEQFLKFKQSVAEME